ncbi:MAG: hypothetical protein U0802_14530 [Candidatus Binatia bacterium]
MGARQAKGEIAVANYDEDALTMAIDAAMAASASPRRRSTAPSSPAPAPLRRKADGQRAGHRLRLPRAIFSADFAGSARSGVSALLAALRAVQSNARNVLVAAADVRVAAPRASSRACSATPPRSALPSAAPASSPSWSTSLRSPRVHLPHWRTDAQRTLQVAGGKFSNDFGYGRDLGAAIRLLLERQKLEPRAIHRVALGSPDARASADLAKQARLRSQDAAGGVAAGRHRLHQQRRAAAAAGARPRRGRSRQG